MIDKIKDRMFAAIGVLGMSIPTPLGKIALTVLPYLIPVFIVYAFLTRNHESSDSN